MPRYSVTVKDLEFDAERPEEAAERARDLLLDPDFFPSFVVRDEAGNEITIFDPEQLAQDGGA